MSDSRDDLSDLRVSQIETQTIVKGMDRTLTSYIELDEERYRDLNSSRLEMSKWLTEVATIVKEVKGSVDCAVKKDIPELQQKVSGHDKKLGSQSWLLRALIGATIIASFSGVLGGLSNCGSADASASEVQVEVVESGNVDGDVD